MAEILASIEDINANVDDDAVSADSENTALIQISVSRIVRGYLSRVIDNVTLASWTDPDNTPEIIREVAAKLIASQLYFNANSKGSLELPSTHVSQNLYNEAMAILNKIIDGTILVPLVTVTPIEGMSDLDYFPVDSTDRAFTLSQKFYGQNA